MASVLDIVYQILEKRRQKDYEGLMNMSCHLVRARIQKNQVQWQEDSCEFMLDRHIDMNNKTVYYKRLDPATLHAVIEFASTNTRHYIIVLVWESNTFKYYNTKEITESDWQQIVSSWSDSRQLAESLFATRITISLDVSVYIYIYLVLTHVIGQSHYL